MDTLRLGKISTINYKDGTARVLYTDRDNAVTAELPLLSFEYRMPAVDDFVLVCHLPNGGAAGIILGPIWNDNNRPPEGKEGLYRKDFDKTAGKCYLRYDGSELKILAPKLTLVGAKSHDWDELLARIERLEQHTHTDSLGGGTSTPK
jgi:hypothetical protein